jgi:proteasome lid subunit RPN8/RPN11
MAKAGQIVLAQVHTHPGRLCMHSDTDDDWAFSDCPGLISIVVPCFGRFGLLDILYSGVGIYERLASGQWSRLAPKEIRQRLLVIPVSRPVIT